MINDSQDIRVAHRLARSGLAFLQVLCGGLILCGLLSRATAEDKSAVPTSLGGISLFQLTTGFGEPTQIHPAIYQARSISNTTLVATSEGNVIIDTSLAQLAPLHKRILSQVNDLPVKAIILTHGHQDHTGGIGVWREPGTEVIAQRNFAKLLNYQGRLAPLFARRNSAQFNVANLRGVAKGNFGATIETTITFDESYTFRLGEVTFELYHTPGETEDHLSVWIPEYKAAFVGDNYYNSFPNVYSLRGTQPRSALDYVASLDKVLSWRPELVVPGHGEPIRGWDKINERLTRQRNAIQYVHDETVRGMNAGKDVYTLMQEIKLPPDLQVPEKYGSVAWSVRGIYEGYIGWFDGEAANMYAESPSEADAELVRLAGGPGKVALRADALLDEGRLVRSLRLANTALACEPRHELALRTRLAALEALLAKANNAIEQGWLRHAIRTTQTRIENLAKAETRLSKSD